MIQWIADNNEVLMVAITFVYVVATIFICIFNAKSAKASKEQIIASQKQQEQNAGLQLYSMRKEIISKIGKHQFDEVFWDVSLLFDDELFKKFSNVGHVNVQLEKLKIEIDWFEKELDIILPENNKTIIFSKITIAKTQKEFDGLESSIKEMLSGKNNNVITFDDVSNYVENLKKVDDLQRIVDANALRLVLELRDFAKKSIQLK